MGRAIGVKERSESGRMFHSVARHIDMKREKEKPKQIKANSFSYTNLPKHTYFHPSLSPFLVYPVCDWF